ncbi:hypothetical protein [Aliterella atlantica]|uniref:Uncharacterized protein n=1 Tax=Aliterella atlantica CENA595 TaxID=1618023 RepID=A0A0D8ZU94_9CYAN|nr:hypothetical protein UH38_16300 [Aliterella atlantica CENA595]
MNAASIKQEAQRLVEELDENATWDDLMYKIYVRQAIEAGLKDSEAGRKLDVSQVRARFGLQP